MINPFFTTKFYRYTEPSLFCKQFFNLSRFPFSGRLFDHRSWCLSFFLPHFFLLQDASKRRTTQRRGLPTGVPGPMYLGTGGTVHDAWRDVTWRDKRIEDRLADGTKPDQILEFHTSMSYVRSAEISFFADNIDLTSPFLLAFAAKFFRIWPLLLSLSLSSYMSHWSRVFHVVSSPPPPSLPPPLQTTIRKKLDARGSHASRQAGRTRLGGRVRSLTLTNNFIHSFIRYNSHR